MVDEVHVMTAELASNPGSLIFLELGETLRRRGRLEDAVRVALSGLEHYPELLDAHDLYARILADIGDLSRAREVWTAVLRRNRRHIGALKGLGFLCFWSGDLDEALDHLESALSVDPTDQTIVQALSTVRAVDRDASLTMAEAPQDPVFAGLDGAERGILLVDDRGRVLGGRIEGTAAADVSERTAAYLAGAAQEAARTARMLNIGNWRWVVSEGEAGNLHASAPSDGALLLITRDRGVPAGRLTMLAQRAGDTARRWIERQRL
jgi:tetratricopeptide (TPR) repeat protein